MRRRGFHLVDVTVLLACLGLLGAILAPATLRSQERSNRIKCVNNLKILGIAAHNYHSDFNRLPPGYFGPKVPNAPLDKPEESLNVGSLVCLLPYLEQDPVYKALRDTTTNNPGIGLDPNTTSPAWWKNDVNMQISRTNLETVFRCPSDPWNDTPSTGVFAAFHAADGKMQHHILAGSRASDLGRTNYTGVAGLWGVCRDNPGAQFQGIFTNRSRLTLGQLTTMDGTSNTLLFGEGLGGKQRGQRDTAWSWIGVGSMVTCYGLSRDPVENTAYRFGSRHENVVQFAFADGSVRGIRFARTAEMPNPMPQDLSKLPGTDWLVFQQLAGYKDGLNNDTSTILD